MPETNHGEGDSDGRDLAKRVLANIQKLTDSPGSEVVLVQSWSKGPLVFLIYRLTIGEPSGLLGTVYDVYGENYCGEIQTDPAIIAYEVISFEMIEPGERISRSPLPAGNVNWRVVADTPVPPTSLEDLERDFIEKDGIL